MSGTHIPSKARWASAMDVDLFEQALREKGISIDKCAHLLGVARMTPRRWMGGAEPTLGRARRAAELLDLTVDDLWPEAA